MRWVYSDPHFWHSNIIKYTNRPFKTVEEMNSFMIEQHNSLVSKADKVFILGDFALSNKEKTEKIVRHLKGNLILIMGNHDRSRSQKWWEEIGFTSVIKYPIIINNHIILSHEPVPDVSLPFINIHGHLHDLVTDKNNYYNVSVEHTKYLPINLDVLINVSNS